MTKQIISTLPKPRFGDWRHGMGGVREAEGHSTYFSMPFLMPGLRLTSNPYPVGFDATRPFLIRSIAILSTLLAPRFPTSLCVDPFLVSSNDVWLAPRLPRL